MTGRLFIRQLISVTPILFLLFGMQATASGYAIGTYDIVIPATRGYHIVMDRSFFSEAFVKDITEALDKSKAPPRD